MKFKVKLQWMLTYMQYATVTITARNRKAAVEAADKYAAGLEFDERVHGLQLTPRWKTDPKSGQSDYPIEVHSVVPLKEKHHAQVKPRKAGVPKKVQRKTGERKQARGK